jgi:hypothetical protein
LFNDFLCLPSFGGLSLGVKELNFCFATSHPFQQ